MIDAVVDAMPLVVKMLLYGAASPVSRSISSLRMMRANSPPGTSLFRNWKVSSLCVAAKCNQLIGHLVVVLQGVDASASSQSCSAGRTRPRCEFARPVARVGVRSERWGREQAVACRAPANLREAVLVGCRRC